MKEKNKPLDLILLLGGTGSRLDITGNNNKALVEVDGKPMVEHLKNKIDEYESEVAPFTNKYIITNGLGLDRIMPILGEGYIYKFQSKPDGLLNAAYRSGTKNDFILHLGDQYYEQPLKYFITGLKDYEQAKVWLKWSDQVSKHNTAILSYDKYIKKFIEKPNLPQGFVSTGIYHFRNDVFNQLPHLSSDSKGETNLADVLNNIIQERDYKSVGYNVMNGSWYDCGTYEVLKRIENERKTE